LPLDIFGQWMYVCSVMASQGGWPGTIGWVWVDPLG
jgi:hypothetical protein